MYNNPIIGKFRAEIKEEKLNSRFQLNTLI